MSGDKVLYRFYKKSSHSYVTIPRPLATQLEWEHKDSINILIKVIENSPSLFLFKNQQGGKTQYIYNAEISQSMITIPTAIAQSLNWKDKDTIYIEPKEIEGENGLILRKIEDR